MSEMHSVGGYWVAQHRWERKCQWGQSHPDRGQSAAEDLALFAPPLAGSGFSSFLHLGRWPQGQSPRLNPLPGLGPGWFRRGLSPLPPRPGGGLACFPRVETSTGWGPVQIISPDLGNKASRLL